MAARFWQEVGRIGGESKVTVLETEVNVGSGNPPVARASLDAANFRNVQFRAFCCRRTETTHPAEKTFEFPDTP